MDKVFDLPVYRAHRWIFNCYALIDDSRPVVVDPGLPSVAGDMLDGLRELGYEAADLNALVCTHAHPDHLGGMPMMLESAAVETHLPGRCESYLEGEQPRAFGLGDAIRFLPVLGEETFSFSALREFAAAGRSIGFGGPKQLRLPFTPSGFLSGGDTLPGLAGWEVVEAPGHTDDSTCYYHRDSRTLLSGDAVVSLDGRAWFNPEWVDADLAAGTEAMLRSLEVDVLLPGHGRPIAGPDIWARARSFDDRPEGKRILARCSRHLGRWPARVPS